MLATLRLCHWRHLVETSKMAKANPKTDNKSPGEWLACCSIWPLTETGWWGSQRSDCKHIKAKKHETARAEGSKKTKKGKRGRRREQNVSILLPPRKRSMFERLEGKVWGELWHEVKTGATRRKNSKKEKTVRRAICIDNNVRKRTALGKTQIFTGS